MTVSTDIIQSPEYVGDGVLTELPFNFYHDRDDADSYVKLFEKQPDGSFIQSSLPFLVIDDTSDDEAGIVILDSPLAAGVTVTVVRDTLVRQYKEIPQHEKFYPKVYEKAFDKLTCMIQELARRAFKLPVGAGDNTNIQSPFVPGTYLKVMPDGSLGWASAASTAGGYTDQDVTALNLTNGVRNSVGYQTADEIRALPTPTALNLKVELFGPQGGVFVADLSDTTTPEDGVNGSAGTVIVSAAGVRYKRQYCGPCEPVWWGADPTGAVDSRDAFRAALDVKQSIYLCVGKWRIDTPVYDDASPVQIVTIVGETGAHIGFGGGEVEIDLSNNASHFISLGYQPTVSHISTKGGSDVFHYTSGGVDGSLVEFNDVSANNFSGTFFKGVVSANGSHTTFDKLMINSSITTSVIIDTYSMGGDGIDNITLNDCWFETASDNGFLLRTGICTINDSRFVPYTNAGSRWFLFGNTVGGTLAVNGTDFGGESQRTLLDIFAGSVGNGMTISFDSCGIYGVAGIPAIKLQKAPKSIAFRSCHGLTDTTGLLSFTGSTAEEVLAFNDTKLVISGCSRLYTENTFLNNSGTVENITQIASSLINEDTAQLKKFCSTSDLVATTGINWQTGGSGGSVTQASGVSDLFGLDPFSVEYTCTADDAHVGVQLNNGPGLSTISNGFYTLECIVTLSNATSVFLGFSDRGDGLPAQKGFNLSEGTHKISTLCKCLAPPIVSVGFNGGLVGSTIAFSRIKVLKGDATNRQDVLYGTADLSTSGMVACQGDKVINSSPSANAPVGWICVTGGIGGTWRSLADIQQY